jgi:DNA polymerase III epsilon subunit-like protein
MNTGNKNVLTVIWCDTETTGLEPIDSGPFEIAFLVYRGGELLAEQLYHLNPLNDEVIIHQSALDVNGATEEQIRGYPPAKEIVPQIIEFLNQFAVPEKYVFAGYNCKFDYGHLGALFYREGILINDYFNAKMIDVLELVERAKDKKLLKPTVNNKLVTITKSLDIEHDEAHTALSDIKATRQLYEHIYLKWRQEKNAD